MARERGADIRAAARTLAQLLGSENRHGRWREEAGVPSKWDGGREAVQGGSTVRRKEIPKEHQNVGIGCRILFAVGDGEQLAVVPPRQGPIHWTASVLPRRGLPVMAIKVPGWYQQGLLNESWP